jgi:hypothetical protein
MEFGGDGQDEREVGRILRAKRAKAFRRVCDAYGLKPRDLASIKAPDLSAMVRRALKVEHVNVSSICQQAAEFIADQADCDEDGPTEHPR